MPFNRQNRVVRRFLEHPPALPNGLRLNIEPVDERHALILVDDDERRFTARAVGLSVPYPSGLRRLVRADPSAEVVLVERASAGLASAAAEEHVGYLDLQGIGHLRGPGFVYLVSPSSALLGDGDAARRGSAAAARRSVSAFAPKASRVTRALLSEPRRAWKLTELAKASDMHPGNAHRILNALDDLALVERDGGGYLVPDPGSLLEAWAQQWRGSQPAERATMPVADLRSAVDRVVGALEERAVVSGELAAELYAPHLPATQAIVHCLDPARLDLDALTDLVGPPLLRGSTRLVIQLSDAGVGDFADRRDGLALASPQQLYVDLFRDRGRGREAAEHLRREVIGF